MIRFGLYAAVLLVILTGCSSVPTTNVHQPMSVRPEVRPVKNAANGSIFQPGSGVNPLFGDQRARQPGDLLTINIKEKTESKTESNTDASRAGSMSAGANLPFTGLPGSAFSKLSMSTQSASNFEGTGNSDAKNEFTGIITVTVIDVLANGNLLVSGEKQLAINQGQEFIRFSGVVNPKNIRPDNSVLSYQVADARIEHKGSGFLSESQVMGWLSRFFLNILPF